MEKWDIPYIDLYSDDDLNLKELKVSTNVNLYDKIHPNSSGFDILAPYIQTWMESLAVAETPATPTPTPTPTPEVTPTPDVTTAPETTAPVDTDEPTAPQTFDFGVIAAVTAIVSAAGYALTKKRK